MKFADEITFGASGLDRAAELRADPEALAALAARPEARSLLFWRGRPLACDGHPVLLPARSPILAGQPSFFLGRDEGGAPLFCGDLTDWQPDEASARPETPFDSDETRHPDLPETHAFVDLRRIMAGVTPREGELAATARALLSWHETHGFCARCGAASVMSHGGWQRHCPACGASHFPRTDPVVIMLITHGNDLLLGRGPGWPEGMYSLLAGFIEPGETVEAAVRREVFEESAVRVGEVDYLTSQPWPFPASLMLGCRGVALSRDIRIDPAELGDALWVSRERLADVFAGTDPQIRGSRKGAIAHSLMWAWLQGRA